MKMRSKSILLTATMGLGLTIGFSQVFNKKNQEVEQVNKTAEYKAKSREKLKPYRYDGSKITFFNYNSFEQKKTVEVLMFNGIDYKFCFNTDGVPKGIDLQIYDKDEVAKDRVMIYEAKGVMGRDVIVTSADMLKNLQEKKSGITSIKKVFLEYHVPIGDKVESAPATEKPKKGEPTSNPQQQGQVVMSYGYKNV